MTRAVCLLLAAGCAAAQQTADNYDESKVPAYTLPDPLTMRSGERVTSLRDWTARRRPEILAVYETEVYGRAPARPTKLNYEVITTDNKALGGKATRKIVRIYFGGKSTAPKMDLLLYLPPGNRPAPVFLGLSFHAIQAIANDPGVPLEDQWVRDPSTHVWVKRPAEESSRGAEAQRWQVEKVLEAGYGLAVAYYDDIEPDFDGGMKDGIRPLYFKPGQTSPAADEWAAIGAWAWALRCAMDYLEKDRGVDAKHVAVIGHSRLGKTALWAGAQDTRFSVVISNESGEGGASISRRLYGETVKDLNAHFPHWFDGNFKKYSDHESEMPFDAHLLMSLIAPRGLYVASAVEDKESDPKGEFLAAAEASRVWEFFGKRGIGTMEMPGLHQPVGEDVRYHVRAGKHDVTAYDWEQYLKFARDQWGK